MASRKDFGPFAGSGDVGKPWGAMRAAGGGGWMLIVYGDEERAEGVDMMWDEERSGLWRGQQRKRDGVPD